MNLMEAKAETLINIKAGDTTRLISDSGIGKSDLTHQIYAELVHGQPDDYMGFGQIFAPHVTPTDLGGCLFKGEKVFGKKTVTVTDPTLPLWAQDVFTGKPAWMFKRFMLVIEEADKAEGDVKKALAEIELNGGIYPHRFPNVFVVACANKGMRYGSTKEYDHCINRRAELTIGFNIQTWLDYVDKPYERKGRKWQTMPVTKHWASIHPDVMLAGPPKEQGPWCTPRSICAVDRYSQVVQEENGGELPLDSSRYSEGVSGRIGTAGMMSYVSHLKFRLELPQYEDIVKDPAGLALPTRPDLLMLLAWELAGWTKPKDVGACITFMERLPKDMAVTYGAALLRRDWTTFTNHPAMTAWINKNVTLLSLLTALSK